LRLSRLTVVAGAEKRAPSRRPRSAAAARKL